MATITGLTAERMLAIEAASIVDGNVSGDDLILTKHDGTTINAGSVRGVGDKGDKGDTGPAGPKGDPGDPGTSADTTIIPTKQVSTDYTPDLSDAGKTIELTNAIGKTFTIPLDATVDYPDGTFIDLFQYDIGEWTIVVENIGDMTLFPVHDTYVSSHQFGTIRLRKRTTNQWVISGDVTFTG